MPKRIDWEHDMKRGEKGLCRCEDCKEELRILYAEALREMGRPVPATLEPR